MHTQGMHTSQGTFEATKSVAEFLGKQVCVSEDRPVSAQAELPCSWDAMLCPSASFTSPGLVGATSIQTLALCSYIWS